MKSRLFLFVAIVSMAFISSCDAIKDATAVDVDTKIKVDVEMSEDAESVSLKSALASYTFNDVDTLKLEDNEDIQDYISGIRAIKTTGSTALIDGLKDNEVIETVTIKAKIMKAGAVEVTLLDDTNIDNTTMELDLNTDNVNTLIESWDDKNDYVIFTVSGSRNFTTIGHSPIKTKIVFPATVSYSPL